MLGEKLKNERILRNLTQSQLAKEISVSPKTISNYESGSIYPPIPTLIKLCEYFNVSSDYLIGLSDEKQLIIEGLNENEIVGIQFLVNQLKNKS